jgi:GT2 family glycosyltransferase
MDAVAPTRSTSDRDDGRRAGPVVPQGGLDLSIVIVNHESWPDTVCLVYSLLRSAGLVPDGASLVPRTARVPLSLEVLVVDNGSGTHPLMETLSGLPQVRLLLESENLGFAAGVNRGWRAARGRHLLVMNPDLLVPETFLSEVGRRVAWLDTFGVRGPARTGVLGFGLVNQDGSPQFSTGYFPKVWWTLAGQFFPRWRRKYRALCSRRPHPCDWVSGACFLARRDVFDQVGGMDEEFFLYYEEVDFCLRARRAGWHAMHDPTLRVKHLHPLERRPDAARFREITRKSQLHYFRKNLPAWHFWLLAAAVRLEERALDLVRWAWGVARPQGHRRGPM